MVAMKREDVERARARASHILKKAGIAVTSREQARMEVADFGLGALALYGFEIVVYENNDRYCAKEIILFPRQTCPEHRHPPVDARNPGKRETFRCRWGEVYLHVAGRATHRPKAVIPESDKKYFAARHEIVLKPGDQFTLPPDNLHWFQAGDQGAILSEFSSTSTDENDIWTNPNIKRAPRVE
jgi:D-lyxose ketol-isomerase